MSIKLDNLSQILRHFQKQGLDSLAEMTQEVIDQVMADAAKRGPIERSARVEQLLWERGLTQGMSSTAREGLSKEILWAVYCDVQEAAKLAALQPNLVDQSLMKARGLDIAIAMAEGFEHAQFTPERREAWAAWYTEWTAEMARRGRVMGVPE